MQPYKLKYHKNSVLLIAMVGIPVFFISLTLYCLFNLPTSLSEPSILVLICLLVIFMATSLLWITRTQIFVSSKVQINEKGIRFKLKSTSFLYRRTNFFCHWDNVNSVTEMFDNHNGGYFYKVVFKAPHFVAYFSPLKKYEKEAGRFFTELQFYKESYNIPLELPLNIKLKPTSSFD